MIPNRKPVTLLQVLSLSTLLACTKNGDSGQDCTQSPNFQNWGKGFLDGKCQSCHASTSPNRHGAPEGIVFDTTEDVNLWMYRIYATIIELESMPPNGGVNDEEKALIEEWYQCTVEE